MTWRVAQRLVPSMLSETLAITKMIVRPFILQEALGLQLKEWSVSRLNKLEILSANTLALQNVDRTARPEEGLKETDCLNQILMTHSSQHNYHSRTRTRTRTQYVSLTHPLAPMHIVPYFWTLVIQRRCNGTSSASLTRSVLQWETFVPRPGTTRYCPSTEGGQTPGGNISLYLLSRMCVWLHCLIGDCNYRTGGGSPSWH